MSELHFSKTYAEARHRFRSAAAAVGASLCTHHLKAVCQDELAIDVATVGAADAPTVVVSSGVHGVEGFFGSAIQLALLERLKQTSAEVGCRYVLIHSLNPFGFSQLRRFNEDNVDLNRNFLARASDYQGAPCGYASLNGFLNPESPPSRYELFKLKALWSIWRNGLQALKQSVAAGQYEYPRGLFFGGYGPCESTQIVYDNCGTWIGAAKRIVHIDFHSGLGPFGTYKLLLPELADSTQYQWYANAFGKDCIELLDAPVSVAYKVSGLFDQWMQQQFSHREYRVVGAEFGTYNLIRVLGAIRSENRAYHYGSPNSAIYSSAKAELVECFCPGDVSWRRQVIESGLKIIEQAASAVS